MVKLSKYDIRYEKSILNWDEALPIGNGKIGSLIYGNGPLRVSIDRVDLWDNRLNPKNVAPEFNFKTFLELTSSDDPEAWEKRLTLYEGGSDLAYPTSITAGRFELDFGVQTDDIHSRVDIEKAIAEVTITEDKKIIAFMSAKRFVGIMRIFGGFQLDLQIPKYISESKNGLRYPEAIFTNEREFLYYKQQTTTEYEYGVVVLKKEYDTYTDLYYTVVSNADASDYIAFAKEELQAVASVGFERLKEEHIAWWKEYWSKSKIDVKDSLIEKIYYRSWYLFASCSRKGFAPMPLQGVWTADDDCLPPWKGDYHYDANVQYSYQSYLKANRLPEGEALIDYLWDLRDSFRNFAKSFFGVKGLLIPGAADFEGNPILGWAQYGLHPTFSIWAAQCFDEYYLYTGDKKFLRERAYPFFKEIATAVCGLLKEKNRKLYLPLSCSPELYGNTKQAYFKPNSNFDLALLQYLFKTLDKYAKALGKNSEAERYEKLFAKLDDIAIEEGINIDGKDVKVVMVDSESRLQESHRHFSHLMCLYPLHLINYDTEDHKRIYEGSLEEIERLGMGLWVGFSYGNCAQIYAMALNGNSAYEKLKQFAVGFVADNGFHLNGDFKGYGYTILHYRPFTLESSFAYCDALHEMLMQDHQGYIHLFPAIPMDWADREISFQSLRSMQGVLVSAKCKNGKTLQVRFKVQRKTEIVLKNTFGKNSITVIKGKNKETLFADENGYFHLTLYRGRTKIDK